MKSFFTFSFRCLYICTVLFHFSCGKGYYAPSDEVMYSPLEKGEFTGSARVNLAEIYRFQGQLAYAPTNHLAVTFGSVQQRHLESYSMSLGLRSNIHNKGIRYFDVYGGYSIVKHTYDYEYYTFGFLPKYTKVVADYQKYFIQGGYHYVKNKFRFDLGLKYNILDWTKIEAITEEQSIDEVEFLRYNDSQYTIDFIPKFSFGAKTYHLTFGCIASLKSIPTIRQEKFNFFSGININLDHLIKNF